MARSNRPLWIFLLFATPALADQRQGATPSDSSTEVAAARSADKQPILADEHGTLELADQRGTKVLADEHGTLESADKHGTLVFDRQQVLADEHGTLVFDMASTSRSTEPQ